MSDLRSFINLIIKQTCRDFAYEYERGWRNSSEEYTTTYKYTLEYLRLLYENPDKYIDEIIGVPSTDSSSEVVSNKEFTDLEKQKLLIFFKNVNAMKPRCSRLWVDLQHYMLYVYRNVVTCNPNPVEERLSKRIRSHMRNIVVELTKEDKCQLYLRLFALLREYVIFAHWHFNKIADKNMCLPRLFHYYEAFLIAADSLRRVFKDFEITLKMNYRLNWVDFNMCIFMHYFYELSDVQTKLYDFKVNDSTSFKTVDMYNLLRTRFSDLHGRWFTKKLGVKAHNKETEIVDEGRSQTENGILIEVQNILSQNFWIQRSPEKRALFNTATMESQVFWLLGDTILKISEPNLDKTGQCICEYCLITKYKYVLGQNQHIPSNRQIPCQICETTVILDNLQQHMNEHENVDDSTESDDSTEQFSNLNGELLNSAFMNEIKSLLDNSSKKALANINQKKELTNGEVPTDKPDWQLEHFFGFSNEEKENIENSHQDMSDIPTYNDFLTFQIALDNHIKNKKEGKANDALDALYFQEFLKHSMYIGQNWPENAKANSVADKKPPEPSPKIFAKPTPLPVEQAVQTVQKEVEKKSEVEQVKSPVPSVKNYRQPPANLQPKPPATLPCGHSCKHGEEVKSDLKKVCQGICDHHSKDAKKCDCTYCEVFGTSKTQINPKDNVTRNRLRIRLLNQRKAKSKLATTETATTSQAVTEPTTTDLVSTQPSINLAESTLYSKTNPIVNGKNVTGKKKKGVPEDLKDQLHYIEGEQQSHAAEKKAAKKARQRLKKEEDRLKKEEEQRKKEEEEAKLRAAQLAKESAEQERESKKDKKKKAKSQQQTPTSESTKLAVYEETIPALVTIKRSHESDTLLTIKFQDRTRNQDELLSSLVRQTNNSNNNIDSNHNTHSNSGQQQNESKKVKKNKQQQQQNILPEKNIAETNNSKKKKKKPVNEKNEKQDSSSVIANEVKITLSIPSQSFSGTSLGHPNTHGHPNMQVSSKAPPSRIASSSSNSEKQQNVNSKDSKKNKQKNQLKENEQKSIASSKKTGKDDSKNRENQACELTNLRLPPGITITKVNGPVSNRNYKSTDLQNIQQNSSNTTSVPVSKSGVIVVDTEKLIQQTSPPATNNATEPSRKSRKKKNRKQQAPNGNMNGTQSGQEIVTLKNPFFNTLHNSKPEIEKVPDMSQGQASIITNENGMVTIRSSRLQQSLNNGTPMPNLLSELKPVIGPDVATPYVPPSSFPEPNRISTFNAQEILSGLPGIEITKVDKCSTKSDNDIRKSCQTAEVSIIPANGAEKFCMEKEDWHYDSVFTPKDILEDDMDAEERELEAFKRFCQQSVPPERKEKVAHLNVKDIVLKKKNDINSV